MLKLGTETGSLVNHLYSTAKPIAPTVGLGATILSWSDRHAGTIIEVRADGSFVVQEDNWVRTDTNGMSDAQSYQYTPNPNGSTYTFEPVKRGKAKGQIRENGLKGGRSVLVGSRDKHFDFSF